MKRNAQFFKFTKSNLEQKRILMWFSFFYILENQNQMFTIPKIGNHKYTSSFVSYIKLYGTDSPIIVLY